MKKKLGALVIVNSIFIVAFVTVTILLGVIYPVLNDFITSMSVYFSNGYFAFVDTVNIFNMSIERMIIEISALSVVLILLILVIVLIAVSAKRKKGAMIAFIIPLAIDFAIAFFTLVNFFDVYFPLFTQVSNVLAMSLSIVAVATAVINLIIGIVLFAVVLKATKVVAKDDIVRINHDNANVETSVIQDKVAEVQVTQNINPSETPEPEPIPVFMPEPEPEPIVNKDESVAGCIQGIDTSTLISMIKEVVRDVVRDELARAELNKTPQNNTAPIPTNPVFVQYFGDNPQVNRVKNEQEAAKIVDETQRTPQKIEVIEKDKSPIVNQGVKPAVVVGKKAVTAKPVVEEVEEAEQEGKIYERISFIDRMIDAEKDMKANYNELKNEVMAYNVHSRVSNSGDTFRLHRKTFLKLTIAGKSLKLYFALDPKDYKDTTIPVQDASAKGIYKEIPLVFKVKSDLSMKRAKQLIHTVMEKDNLKQREIVTKDWIKELKNATK